MPDVRCDVRSGVGCVDSLGLDNKVAMCGEISRELDYVTDTNTALITFKIGRDHQAEQSLPVS